MGVVVLGGTQGLSDTVGAAATLDINLPTGCTPGDFLLSFLCLENTGGGAPTTTVDAEWTMPATWKAQTGSSVAVYMAYHWYTGTYAGDKWRFTPDQRGSCVTARFTGVSRSRSINVATAVSVASYAALDVAAPAADSLQDGDMVFGGVGMTGNPTLSISTASSAMSPFHESSTPSGTVRYSTDYRAGSSTGTTWSQFSNSTARAGILVTLPCEISRSQVML